jgi:hypothetical protein
MTWIPLPKYARPYRKGGADAEFVNARGETCLMTCAKHANMTPGILALLNAGANPNTESIKLKTTALMVGRCMLTPVRPQVDHAVCKTRVESACGVC